MKRIFSFLLLLSCLKAWANDGIFYTSGSFLIPVQETDISVSREVLTITIGKGGYAEVDVQYEFDNPKAAKTVLMAFEANAPYNAQSAFNRKGIHPFIKDFTVTMNGRALQHRNAVVAQRYNYETDKYESDLKPLDLDEWIGYGEDISVDGRIEDDVIYYKNNPDSSTSFAYAYYFDAPFRKGRNTVHHTYKYQMSVHVGEDFRVPYWLTPATRWANHQIDDFTLRIIDERGDGFCMEDSIFKAASFKATKGECWQLDQTMVWDEKLWDATILFAQPYSTAEWHGTNFCPVKNIVITSCNTEILGTSRDLRNTFGSVVEAPDGTPLGRFIGACGDHYLIEVQDYGLIPKTTGKPVVYNSDNGQGWLIIAPEYTGVNIREQPNAQSPIITTIYSEEGELPEVYPCLGRMYVEDKTTHNYKEWFHIKVGDKTGYVNANLMLWDAINTY